MSKDIETKELTTEDAKAMEHMLRQREVAQEPGTLNRGDLINSTDNEALPLPMGVTEVSSAGYSYIYDTKTGERSLCNNNNLLPNLMKRRKDGTPFFTTNDPGIEPVRGTYMCMLSPTAANRDELDAFGFTVCGKANLKSPYEVERHMSRRHPSEWQILNDKKYRGEEAKREQERQEDRNFQKKLLEALVSTKKEN